MKKISKETLALVNKVDDIHTTIIDGGVSCLRYVQVEEMMDALRDVIKLFDLKRQGGISEYGDNKGEYERKFWSDYVAPTDPKAYDPSKDKENV